MLRTAFIIIFCIISFASFGQGFKLPPIPAHDSVKTSEWTKTYFQNGVKVFEINYHNCHRLYGSFGDVTTEDSSYTYFNGPAHEEYDMYYIDDDHISNTRFSETSSKMFVRNFNRENVLLVDAEFWITREPHRLNNYLNVRYPVGQLTKWANSNGNAEVETVVDYKTGTINGKYVLSGKAKLIDSLKRLADQQLDRVYGKKFVKKYVRFNWGYSGYMDGKLSDAMAMQYMRSEQPIGKTLFVEPNEPIIYVDLTYDIVIGEDRFNAIKFRIWRDGKILGKTYLNLYKREEYLTSGLDKRNKGKLHPNVLNYRRIATENGFEVNNKKFSVHMGYKPVSDLDGELSLILEQVKEVSSTNSSTTIFTKRISIDPWTGKVNHLEDGKYMFVGG